VPRVPDKRGSAVKIVVDFDKCKSNAVCMAAAPEVFEVRDDNFLYILQEEPGEELRPQVEEAARTCPTGAIVVEG
jgi:ferredoxin